MTDLDFYKNKKVLVTGHTGFKGAWLSMLLLTLGADVSGYALEAPTDPALFHICGLDREMKSVIGDIRDLDKLNRTVKELKPEIIIHMAAQPIVRESYKNPVFTYETNVMGTVNLLETVRLNADYVKSVVNVTTDKVYRNIEQQRGYKEEDELNGYDPYSNSKSCSELVTSSYKNSFFIDLGTAISTARAGNVIGGGDFAKDRIIPDCVRAVEGQQDIIVRNPYSVRPYQHVLEPVVAYLMLAKAQYEDKDKFEGNYNIGPNTDMVWKTGELVQLFCDTWQRKTGKEINWIDRFDGGPHEANYLMLDNSKFSSRFGWKPKWDMPTTMNKIVEWYDGYMSHNGGRDEVVRQIGNYLNLSNC